MRKGVQNPPRGDIVGRSCGSVGPRHCCTWINFFSHPPSLPKAGGGSPFWCASSPFVKPTLPADPLWGNASGLSRSYPRPLTGDVAPAAPPTGGGPALPSCVRMPVASASGRVPAASASGVQPPPLSGSVSRACFGLPLEKKGYLLHGLCGSPCNSALCGGQHNSPSPVVTVSYRRSL